MELDHSKIFEEYEKVVEGVDKAFKTVEEAHSDCVKCKPGCSDCCYALFDLSLVEALYINHHFNKRFEGKEKDRLLERADRADRKIHMIKKEAYQATKKGRQTDEILSRVAWERVRCPLLDDDEKCILYDKRPITCRLYGIPTAIGGKGHTCGESGFEEGKPYPTVNLDSLNAMLYQLSQKIVASIPTKYVGMADMLVPLSMALLTEYNKEYLGIKEEKEEKE
ncbi:Putative zinc-or iron-chelating domain-containing protein [Desulfatibacillum alkenivorans DSM 16219]|jgi:Fe-S-cluster containining protein|uniref:Putative zinc-or iron-chelating domain-containing protein n=1 Tax=Desulfatibacillum alkenivorans DSM 16219 TaxID=1121393 RepID=A0A1M6KDH3_9BACT|nr:YkgJ family cysteine cluster protein [Desulfatibacillum alkenivorans]SHJ56993.1 Putative zinc-or iron-chelating domain-containing protein [Desulfatibacillum alkenivorans DSM 16219]